MLKIIRKNLVLIDANKLNTINVYSWYFHDTMQVKFLKCFLIALLVLEKCIFQVTFLFISFEY